MEGPMHSGSLNLTVTSPPQSFTEPLTLAQAEHYLSLPTLSPVDAGRDALIESLITAARETAEAYQGRDLIPKQWDLTLEAFPVEIELRAPLVTVDLVKYRDSSGTWTILAENTDYIADLSKHPGIIRPPYDGEWPSFTAWPTSPILIRFTSGYASTDAFWDDAGQRIRTGMKLLISHWFNSRDLMAAPGAGKEVPYSIEVLLGTGALPRSR
jgi:uncharacterized phiE125 gp8 family phage protein